MDSSVFRMVSIGIVAEMKPRNDPICNVIQSELASALNGEARFNPKKEQVKGVDRDGTEYTVNKTTDVSVQCTWFPYDDNRATPPDVVRGEIVEVWRNAETDDYYWRPVCLKMGLRSLETCVFMFGATNDVAKGHQNKFENCYYLMFSGHDGHITLSTAMANGEKFSYKLQLNGKDGEAFLKDNINNIVRIASKTNLVELINADFTSVKLERKNIEMKAEEYIKMTVGGSEYKMTPSGIQSTTQQYGIKSSTFQADAATSFTVNTGVVTYNCTAFNIIV